MTIQEAMVSLLDFFRNNESFILERDYRKIELICVDDDYSKSVITKALEKLEKTEVVEKTEANGKNWYVLAKPLEHHSQQIIINYPINAIIAATINHFSKQQKDKYASDPLNITQTDVQYLLSIIEFFINAQASENQDKASQGGGN